MEGQIIRCGYLEVREENEAKKLNPQDFLGASQGLAMLARAQQDLTGEASRGRLVGGLECHTKKLALQAVGDEE